MAIMRNPVGNICDELEKLTIRRKDLLENGMDRGTGELKINLSQMKTLTRASRKEMPLVKAEIEAMLPILSHSEVRRYRIPYYKSVILDLEEANLQNAADYIRRLFQLNEDSRKNDENLQNSLLKTNNNLIDILRDGLSIANRANKQKKSIIEAAAFLEMALSFQSKSSEWYWIAEELFKSAIEVSKQIRNDGGQTLTTVQYLYGRFLKNETNNLEKALLYLNEAWKKSENKPWSVPKVLGMKQKTVFSEICMLLHKIYLSLAKRLRKVNPSQAIQTCMQALEKAQDCDCEEYIADSIYELGKCELESGNAKKALRYFSKYLALMKRLQNLEGICNAHEQLAFAYKEIKDEENTMKHFRLFKETASEFQLPYKLAQAHYYIGEHFLNQGNPKIATPYLEYSVSLYRSLNAINECDKARCFAGVSKGQEVLKDYIKLILDCGRKNSGAILKLCKWKSNREPFWIEKKSDEEKEFLDELENQNSKISFDSFFSTFSHSTLKDEIFPAKEMIEARNITIKGSENQMNESQCQIVQT